ncbi:DUF4345 domain-containing protein [Sphingomonas sp. LB-2]|uniref:DUF4345 domain-containing protein n=1 Tax=Sphingomonas caeni TaxID=2984949 RepID=UPI00223152A0|nr:DUF4345 domain-containing protein [Sphingomonas caeni]MCW3847958.1 DUF4345 domain-containing protein [Sphingomonas caeni]
MTPGVERRLLQIVCTLAALVPLGFGTIGVLRGAAWLAKAPVTPDLDSHFRYLSGIFLMLGIGFASCIPRIEAQTGRFRLLGAMVIAGGLARALSLAVMGAPSTGHLFGLGMELVVVPLLLLWQARFAAR